MPDLRRWPAQVMTRYRLYLVTTPQSNIPNIPLVAPSNSVTIYCDSQTASAVDLVVKLIIASPSHH